MASGTFPEPSKWAIASTRWRVQAVDGEGDRLTPALGQGLWYTAIKADTNRGLFFRQDTNFNLPLNHDSTIRAVLGRVDVSNPGNPFEPNVGSAGSSRARVDVDNADSPSAIVFSPGGDYVFTALQGNDAVAVFDDLAIRAGGGRSSTWRFDSDGGAPQGLLLDPATERLWIKNFTGRSATSLPLGDFFDTGDRTLNPTTLVTTDGERLALDVIAGKRHFYFAGNAVDGQNEMSFEGYISCASCHLDGGHDGRTWDFTQRGEGFRNTTALNGRAGVGQGNVHWTGNFDEIQDFVNDIQNEFGGGGFLPAGQTANPPLGSPNGGRSQGLDDLSAFVSSLDTDHLGRSPYRAFDGSLTPNAQLGAVHFDTLACANCHPAATGYTDSTVGTATLHDVGTLRSSSGQRLGGALPGIDTPTLLGLHSTGPYLHDGSAPAVGPVWFVTGGERVQMEDGALSGGAGLPGFPDINEDSSFHGEMVDLPGAGAAVTLTGVDGGVGGPARLELRYWPKDDGTLRLIVNGVTVEDKDVREEIVQFQWQRLAFDAVPLTAGPTNTVRIERVDTTNPGGIGVDDLTIGNADERAKIEPHRVVLDMSDEDQADLVLFLRSLDRSDVVLADPPLFADGFESGDLSAWSRIVQ
ncbi:MAG: hypothetical protein AAFX50_00350 [Acidobacteriota bacterium]